MSRFLTALGERLRAFFSHAIDWYKIRRGSVAAAWLTLIAVLIALWGFGVPRLQAFVSSRQIVVRPTVQFLNAPAWVRGDLLTRLEMTAQAAITGDLLAQTDLVLSREDLLQTGWFEQVRQVKRLPGNVIEIDARFVEPYAVIRDKDGDHLVDPRARLLPVTFPVGSSKQVVVLGARFKRPAYFLEAWEGADVSAALRVMRLIDARPWRSQVVAVDVSAYTNRQMLTLVTNRGTRINWGAAPGEEFAREVPAHQKLSYLDYQFEHFEHIDRGDRELDIFLDTVNIVR